MTAAQHPHDPFRPATAGDAPPPAPEPAPEPEPATPPASQAKPKRGRRSRRASTAPKESEPHHNDAAARTAEDELAAALAELDDKDTSRDDSAG